MQKRELGKTGLVTSLIGFGGFHLLEIPQSDATRLLNRYLDAGGNYIETASAYGNGVSEKKIGRAVSQRRNEYILASKCHLRSMDETRLSIEKSLENLKTDYLDILYLHGIQKTEEAQAVLAPAGALAAAQKAREEGKIGFIGITGHGQMDAVLYSIGQFDFDVLMTGFNYYDRFNFPKTESILLPRCQKQGIGVIGMKALADGYLHNSWKNAIRYALSLPISSLVLGINTDEYLERDLSVVTPFKSMEAEELKNLFQDAPELGDYVCRMCKKCKDSDGFEPYLIFLLEGLYDRQMDDQRLPSTAAFALRERLKFWFGQSERALDIYKSLRVKVNFEKDYSNLNSLCPYGIDIDRKLKICHAKLSQNVIF